MQQQKIPKLISQNDHSCSESADHNIFKITKELDVNLLILVLMIFS